MYTKFILSGKNPGKIAGNLINIFFTILLFYAHIISTFCLFFAARKWKPEKFWSKVFLINIIFFSVKTLLFLGNISGFPPFFY